MKLIPAVMNCVFSMKYFLKYFVPIL